MSDIQAIELSIEEAKKLIDLKDQALKLSDNREFRNIILEGYFKDEAARLASLTADSTLKANREDIILALQGISSLRQYLQTVIRMGQIAEGELHEAQEVLEEARLMEVTN